mgnify:CR=1 FL=1
MNYTYADVAKMIDHSLLNPTLSQQDLDDGCRLAVEYDVASVCIMPYSLKRCAEILRGSGAADFPEILKHVQPAAKALPKSEKTEEFLELVRQAKASSGRP